MSSPANAVAVRDAAPLFAALGDETRLALLVRLCNNGPDSIVGLSQKAKVSRQAITKHLDVLANAGLVSGERCGRQHIWKFAPERLDDAHAYLDRIGAQWDSALSRLAKLVED